MIPSEVIFNTLVYKELLINLHLNNTVFKNKAFEIKEKFLNNSSTDWRCDTFNTLNLYDYREENDTNLKDLVYIVSNKVQQFATEYGIPDNLYDIHCDSFWFNISMPGNYQEFHQHSNSHFSVVYYVDAPEHCGNIVFKSFETFTDMFPLPIENSNTNLNSAKTHAIVPQDSLLLIFRSNLLHMVEKNNSNKDRISIAMNFKLVPKSFQKNYIKYI